LFDGVGGGADGDLQLLIPQLGLLGFNIIVIDQGLVVEFKALLPQLADHGRDCQGAEEAQKKLEHEFFSLRVLRAFAVRKRLTAKARRTRRIQGSPHFGSPAQ
jgi:hypothetical protein